MTNSEEHSLGAFEGKFFEEFLVHYAWSCAMQRRLTNAYGRGQDQNPVVVPTRPDTPFWYIFVGSIKLTL